MVGDDKRPSHSFVQNKNLMKHYTIDGAVRIECSLNKRLTPYWAYIKHRQAVNTQKFPDEPQISREALHDRLRDTWPGMKSRDRRVYETLAAHHNDMRVEYREIRNIHCAHCYHHKMEKQKTIPACIPLDPIWEYHRERVDETSLADSRDKFFDDALFLQEEMTKDYNGKYQERLLEETKCDECNICRESS